MRLHKKSIRLLAFLTLFITMLSIGSYNVSADASYWAALGNAGFSAGVTEYPSIAVVGNTPYVAYRDGNTGLATVMKFDGLNWVDVGNWSLSGCYSGTGVEIAIGSGGIPYIFYSDDDYFGKATVKRLEGDTWIDVGSGGFSSSSVTELSMDIDSNGTPYVAYKENDNGYVKRFNGTSWDTVGGTYFAAGGTDYIDIALDASNNPYVVYSDWSVPTEPKGRVAVRRFDGVSWGGKLGGEIGSGQSSFNSIEIVNGVPIIAYKDAATTGAMVKIFNGSTWEAAGSGAISQGYANYTDMALDNTTAPATPYVVYLDSSTVPRATVKKLDGTSWVTVGVPRFTAAQADYLSIAMGTGGKPYIAFKDTGSSYRATVYQGFIKHNLTYTPSGHGSISGQAAQIVDHGANGTAVTAVPETYYYFDKWSDNSTANLRTDINVQKDIAVSAAFIANTAVSANLNNVPAAQAVNEDQQLVISTANGNAISILNPGVEPAELMKVSLTAANGTITLSRTTGLAFSVGGGAGVASMAFTGTLTNINQALNGLSFSPQANYNGSAAISIQTDDQGNSQVGITNTDADTVQITVNAVNDAPTFAKGADQTVLEDSGAQSFAGWATGIGAGPSDESGQSCSFTVTNDNNSLFSAQPAVAANGTLTFTPAADAYGSATVTVSLHDNGGTANGGVDASASQTFIITISPVNEAPSFTKGADKTELEDSGAQSFAGWATGISTGPSNESGQACSFTISNDNNGLFSAQPAVAANGTLTFTPAANANGSTTVTVSIHDDGGTSNGGVDASASQTFTITVTAVNDAPSFTKGADQTVNEDSGAQTEAGWATGIGAGPADESAQTLTFNVTNNNNGLFSAQPAVAANGTLTFTPAANVNGSATVTVSLHDDGGTSNGGVDASAAQTFIITVSPVNEAPSFTKGADKTVLEDSGAQSFTGWATGISAGPVNESGQVCSFTVSNDNAGLFLAQPAVAMDGTLTFTPAANANGSATVTVSVHDNGGTANGGVDASASQTFTITVTSVNDSPTFTKGADKTVNEDSGAQTEAGWATGIGAGPADELAQTLTFNVTNNNNGLFSVQPSVALDGTLTYTPAADANGSATVTVTLTDNGGGADTSAAQTFIITINSVNDGSSFTKGADQSVNEDSGAQTVAGWATGITAGPPNESGQTLEFIVTNDNNGLFSVQPAVEADGTLTYTPAADANGNATVIVILTDNGGVDTTAPQTFTINVSVVNDAPSFTKGADQSISEDSGSQTIEDWATVITAGPADESGQSLTFNVTNDNNSLFSVQPSVALDGKLTYTPVADANGSAIVTVALSDNGGGADTSTAQTFVITLSSVNDTPSFVKGADQIVNEGCGVQTVAGWATAVTAGPANESGQTLEFIVTNDNNGLFSMQPAVSSNGTLTYTVADDTSGIATVSVRLKDNGGGMDTSNAQTFVIKVCAQSGSGEITLSQDTFTAGETGSTITFTYTAASGGMEDGKLAIEVPDGWSSPSTVATANGYATASTGIVSISGRTIIVSDITVSSGDTISIKYGDKTGGGSGAAASTVKGLYEWNVRSAAMADSTLSSLVSSPEIRILPDTTSETQSSISAGDSDIPADGQTTTTITVILADAYGNTIEDHNVSLSQGSGASTISPSSVITGIDGKAVFTVSSDSAGTVTYTAKDNTEKITLSENAEVTFKPGIKYTKAAVNIEEGETAEYSVSLVSCPSSEVTVTAAVYDELDVSPMKLIFDAGNWNIDQIFSLTSEDNSSKDGDRLQTVTNSVYSSDLQYDGLDFDITVNILDNDTPGVSIIQSGGDTGVGEAGTEDSYTVKLFTKPKGDVVVSVHTDNQLTVEPVELTFTPLNWNTAQSFTVRAFDDHLIEGVHSSTISHTISSSDNDYDDIDISDITVGIADNDFPEDPSDDASLKSLEISHGALTPGFDPAITKYNVSVANNIGSIAITPTVTESHGSIAVNGIAVISGTASHTIILSVGKNTINVQVTAQDGVTKKTYVIEVVRASNQSDDDNDGPPSGGGGNAGGSVIPKENLPVQQPNKGSDGKVSITVSPKLDSNGTAAASLDAAALANAFGLAEAGADGVRTVIFDIPGVEGANAYDCKLPASYLSSGDSNRSVEIKTDIASVTVPGNMLLRESPEGSQSISLIIASADKNRIEEDIQAKIGDRPVIELYLMIDGKKIPWSNKNAPVTVAIPYTPTAEELKDPEHITVWYIDSAGNTVSVPSGRYDPATGKVTFSTTHFSQYAVVYVGKTFSDMGSYSWARKQIEVLASKGITNGTSEKAFSPQVNISRGDYLVLLVKTLGLTADFDSNFVDVKPADYYYEAAGIARKLGIAAGDKENRFDPRTDICRQDMMVLTARALEISGKLKPVQETSAILDKYSDKAGLAVYAVESAVTLVSEKLITGSDGRLNPVGHTTRAEAAVLLYRIYNMYND